MLEKTYQRTCNRNLGHIRPIQCLIKARIGFSEPHYSDVMALQVFAAMNNNYNIQLKGLWMNPVGKGAWFNRNSDTDPAVMAVIKVYLKPEVRSAYNYSSTGNSSSQQQVPDLQR